LGALHSIKRVFRSISGSGGEAYRLIEDNLLVDLLDDRPFLGEMSKPSYLRERMIEFGEWILYARPYSFGGSLSIEVIVASINLVSFVSYGGEERGIEMRRMRREMNRLEEG
jgi:hypothetical protein